MKIIFLLLIGFLAGIKNKRVESKNYKTMPYKQYLKTEQWQKKRFERLAIDDYRCQACGKKLPAGELNVHHLTYKRRGNENVKKDLRTLCKAHHKAVHDLAKNKEIDTPQAKFLSQFFPY